MTAPTEKNRRSAAAFLSFTGKELWSMLGLLLLGTGGAFCILKWADSKSGSPPSDTLLSMTDEQLAQSLRAVQSEIERRRNVEKRVDEPPIRNELKPEASEKSPFDSIAPTYFAATPTPTSTPMRLPVSAFSLTAQPTLEPPLRKEVPLETSEKVEETPSPYRSPSTPSPIPSASEEVGIPRMREAISTLTKPTPKPTPNSLVAAKNRVQDAIKAIEKAESEERNAEAMKATSSEEGKSLSAKKSELKRNASMSADVKKEALLQLDKKIADAQSRNREAAEAIKSAKQRKKEAEAEKKRAEDVFEKIQGFKSISK